MKIYEMSVKNRIVDFVGVYYCGIDIYLAVKILNILAENVKIKKQENVRRRDEGNGWNKGYC